MIPGSDRIPASLHTEASETKSSSQHKVSGCRENSGFSTINLAKETLFIDLTFPKIETVKRMVPAFVPFAKMETEKTAENGSLGHCLTPASVLSVR